MTDSLRLRVADCLAEAKDVLLLVLASADGRPLPAADPGAHLELRLPSGMVRHYSLCGDASDRSKYVIGVGRAAASRGGSEHIHRHVRVGTELPDARLRNHFPLEFEARRYRFIAGGIGITPILSMVRWCVANARPWSLAYAARSRQRTAFYEWLAQYPEAVRFHFDDEAGGAKPALQEWVSGPLEGEHLYCCGPGALMTGVQDATASWTAGSVHFEWFAAPKDAASEIADKPFVAVLQRSGQRIEVPAGCTLLEALEQHGVEIPFSCREGLCRTCETPLCGGVAEHRDHVLSEAERAAQRSIMPCVSRAKSDELLLDL